jgi:hypothetical protein
MRNINKILFVLLAIMSSNMLVAQTDRASVDAGAEKTKKQAEMDLTKMPNGWQKGGNLLLGFNYTNVNKPWAAGSGASQLYNAIFNGALNYNATRKYGKTLWINDLNYVYTSQANPGTNDEFRSAADLLNFSTMYAPQIKPKWFYGFNLDLRTQLFNSYTYTGATKLQNGSFLTNGIIRAGVGFMYTPNKNFRIYFSPLTANIATKLGAWAKSQERNGVKIDETTAIGLGSLLRTDYNNSWKTNTQFGTITYSSRMDLFTDYLKNPFTVINVDWFNSIGFNLTKYIGVAAQVNFRYYHDQVKDLQNQNMVGLSFNYKL